MMLVRTIILENHFRKNSQAFLLTMTPSLGLLNQYSQFYDELPFPEKQNHQYRYYYENSFFSYSDAVFLYSFLRTHKPKRIIEIGSGFSSAVILDTVELFFTQRPDITFIEPSTSRLKKLLKSEDSEFANIV